MNGATVWAAGRSMERIEQSLPGREDTVGVTAKDNRLFVEAVIYRYRAGHPVARSAGAFWRLEDTHRRHRRWSESGVWKRVFEHLAEDADNEYAMIDSTIVRAHQHAAGAKGDNTQECIGRSKGGLTTKIHASCDAFAIATGFHLTPGQAHDLEGADALLPDLLTSMQAFPGRQSL